MAELSRDELLAMRDDVEADLVNLHETLEWIDSELEKLPVEPLPESKRRYTKLTDPMIRDAIRKLGSVTPQQLAEALGCSVSALSTYRLPPLYESGMLVRVRKGGKTYYSIAKPQHGAKRNKKQPPRLKIVGGTEAVARTGKRNYKRMKRRGAIKGVKGQ